MYPICMEVRELYLVVAQGLLYCCPTKILEGLRVEDLGWRQGPVHQNLIHLEKALVQNLIHLENLDCQVLRLQCPYLQVLDLHPLEQGRKHGRKQVFVLMHCAGTTGSIKLRQDVALS
jgi:hypothetical protein